MSATDLQIGGIFITMAASALGYGIPFIRGAPKDHDDALSVSWMSIKCFSSGVIFSVAMVHLLGEALEVLREHQVLLFPEDEHRRLEEDEHDEHGHQFPFGMTLCVFGAILTLGVELLTNMMMAAPDSGANNKPTSTQNLPSLEDTKLITKGGEGSSNDNTSDDIEMGGNEKRSRGGTLCDDPYRLEPGHSHHSEENIHCHVEHAGCDVDHVAGVGVGVGAGAVVGVGEVVTYGAAGCTHPEEQHCSSSCSSNETTTHLHLHSHTQDPDNANCDINGVSSGNDDIHRHVSIIVEDRNKSVVKSIILETCISIHSIIIGVGIGTMSNPAELGLFLVAISFHQLFEGISLGAASMQASFDKYTNLIFMLVFICSLPLGIIIGLLLPVTDYGQAIQACFSCIAAGSLIYTALVEMVAEDFAHVMHCKANGEKQQPFSTSEAKKIGAMFCAFTAGCMGMAIIGQWA
jgi:zinc transporter ZupT